VPAQSVLHPIIEKFIHDEWIRIERAQLTPWAFFHAGPMRVKDFYGREIAYGGLKFSGSPVTIYWSRYIEPFLEDLAFRAVDLTLEQSRTRNIDVRQPLVDVQGLLHSVVTMAFDRMAAIDQRLRQANESVLAKLPLRRTDRERAQVIAFIDKRIDAELRGARLPPSRWARANQWHKDHPLFFWALGAVITLTGILGKALGWW
jgi:hypothetical protein